MTTNMLCVNALTYNPDDDTYYGYISKIPEGVDLFSKLTVFEDDMGFRLKAHSDPSMYVEFVLADTEHNPDGSVSAWIYVAVPDSHTMRMGKLDSKVKIINF